MILAVAPCVGKMSLMSPRHRTITPIEPYEDPDVRDAWAAIRPETLAAFASRVDMTARQVKHSRQLHADGFPEHIPVDGKYMASMMVFSGDLLDLWLDNDFDLREAPEGRLADVRAEVVEVVSVVRPVTLAVVAGRLLPDLSDAAAVRRMRTWRDTRDVTGFPRPLEFDSGSSGSHLFASMIYSATEIEAWFADFTARYDVSNGRRVLRGGSTPASPSRREPRKTSKRT